MYTVAIVLVVVSMVAAEIPRQHVHRQVAAPQQNAPYLARGFRPTGRPFNLPLKSTALPTGVEAISTTTAANEQKPVSTTEEVTAKASLPQQITKPEKLTENLEPDSEKVDVPQQQQQQEQHPQFTVQAQPPPFPNNPQMLYVVYPQNRNFAYSSSRSSQLVAVPGVNLVASPARLQTVPVLSSGSVSSSVFSPFSSSFVQIYQ